jgi:hypothetical protein
MASEQQSLAAIDRGVVLMRLISWGFLIVLFTATSLCAQDITTSQGLRRLPPLKGLTSENSLRQANAIAEIVLGELALDAAALDKKEAALLKEVAAYEQKKDEEQAVLDDPKGPFKVGEKKYLERLTPFLKRLKVHDIDAAKQRAEALASNNLPPAQRNAETVSRLNEWVGRIDDRKVALDEESGSLKEELTVLERFAEDANARLTAIREPLEAKIARHKFEQGLAYRQLKQCATYKLEIEKIAKARNYNWKADIYSPALDSAIERLKKLGGDGFDTP